MLFFFFFFKQKTAYEMRISEWSSDVCSSDVFVISCPHALGLAIPLTTSISSALAARHGILVKDRLALEQSRNIEAFLFDKTGTRTKDEHTLMGVAGLRSQERR